MTDDTKRAVEILRPIMEELRIPMEATNSRLILRDDAIGIECNSTWATIMEAIGWLFLKAYAQDFRPSVSEEMDYDLRDDIQRYWIKRKILQKFGMDDQAPKDKEFAMGDNNILKFCPWNLRYCRL